MNAGTLSLGTVSLGTSARFAVEDLSIGMFVSSLDIPATQAPFPLQGFYIATKDDLLKISYYCKWVIVNITKSRTAESLEPKFFLEKDFGKQSNNMTLKEEINSNSLLTGQQFQGKESNAKRLHRKKSARSKKMNASYQANAHKKKATINTPKNNPFRALMVLFLLSAGFFMIR